MSGCYSTTCTIEISRNATQVSYSQPSSCLTPPACRWPRTHCGCNALNWPPPLRGYASTTMHCRWAICCPHIYATLVLAPIRRAARAPLPVGWISKNSSEYSPQLFQLSIIFDMFAEMPKICANKLKIRSMWRSSMIICWMVVFDRISTNWTNNVRKSLRSMRRWGQCWPKVCLFAATNS